MTTQDVLRQAKELLSDEGRWCSDGPGSGERTFCALRALGRVGDGYSGRWSARATLALQEVLGHSRVDLWNDNPETTHADVIAVFDRALLLVAEQEARETRREAVVA